jgi:hypothetical protein
MDNSTIISIAEITRQLRIKYVPDDFMKISGDSRKFICDPCMT